MRRWKTQDDMLAISDEVLVLEDAVLDKNAGFENETLIVSGEMLIFGDADLDKMLVSTERHGSQIGLGSLSPKVGR
ncbi:hypothetical protein N7519_007505 [Penicillium mononematosum]|uniref:uncharacterized protein n=1 Tax=Penicillium mononematosum TaxID=268346 RepID=UPI0025489611|nr:uncharacterized protein N7519_007505 [Penicillium mononematosum]KAJ6186204.1 hypothetical protein N7519_007505 [Penicillium mononematosum]